MSTSLHTVLEILEQLAPLALAESWDNVGLLVEAPTGGEIQSIHLAIDLNVTVLEEAIAASSGLIVAYHPPIFAPLQRLLLGADRQGVLLAAIASGISIYSPHTALDAVPGGVTEWLAGGLGAGDLQNLRPEDSESSGPGRMLQLEHPAILSELLKRIKAHLNLDTLRVAATQEHKDGKSIARIGICPGAGGSVLAASGAELLLTGEMRHHDVLAALNAGTSVILCEHSSSERGYLPVFRERLKAELGRGVEVSVCSQDIEPISYR